MANLWLAVKSRAPALASSLLVFLSGASTECRREPPPPIRWETRYEAACKVAAAESKPVLLHIYATWDSATMELENVTFADPDVRTLVNDRYVALRVDRSDSWMQEAVGEAALEAEKLQRTYRVATKQGPVIILKPNCKTEVDRLQDLFPPREFSDRLVKAHALAVR